MEMVYACARCMPPVRSKDKSSVRNICLQTRTSSLASVAPLRTRGMREGPPHHLHFAPWSAMMSAARFFWLVHIARPSLRQVRLRRRTARMLGRAPSVLATMAQVASRRLPAARRPQMKPRAKASKRAWLLRFFLHRRDPLLPGMVGARR